MWGFFCYFCATKFYQMKKIYFLFIALCVFTGVTAQSVYISDFNLKMKLVSLGIDTNSNLEIEYSEAEDVTFLNISNSNINYSDGLEAFTNLQYLDCSNNNINALNISNLLNLQYLDCSNNIEIQSLMLAGLNLSSLTINGLTNLQFLSCQYNDLTWLDLSGLTSLQQLECGYNQLTTLNLSGLINLNRIVCHENQIGQLDVSQVIGLTDLICFGNDLTLLNVSGLTNLRYLDCNMNRLPSLNVSGLTNLKHLNCSVNQLPSINVSGLTNLEELYCGGNQLPVLNVSGLINLRDLRCAYNQLPSLNLTGLVNIRILECYHNLFSSLNLSELINLEYLACWENQLSSLNVSGLVNLRQLHCSLNQLSTLDLSDLSLFTSLTCNSNQLTSLFIKNGSNEAYLEFSNNPDLQFICADESQLVDIQNKITTYGYTNCHTNSYCSFTPGGTFYTIQGNNKYDKNNNGCDVLDLGLPNLKFNVTDGTNSGSSISNATGNYNIPVIAGTHTITPVFENPSYFTILPTNVVVDFPTQASPFTQNFCVTANGVHPDLEVTLLSIAGARPGFDAKYKVVYKNKGNTTQSGTVNVAFNDAILDFVSANPSVLSQAINNLSWDFVNLLPFETREIAVTLNVNSPIETPAVNGGDVLNYTATITSAATDDLPNDNTFAFNQTVVNSFDPNDKTCLEGATIAPAKVGEYVHYMIRFENNGTANAQNIVVKDMIDLAKFDINSIVPMKGSHSFVTNITSGNKVEFIFENINLPFDDANNDGYVAFKIKTKPTLVLGDTFSNTASIYFDYNFPIVTNTATTTIAALSRQDFEFSNYFNVYPNPVHDVLNIAAKETIEISSINIYNTLGQLVLVIPNAQNAKTVDVSSLSSGNYFIKINSDKGTSNTKFIKN